MNERVSKRVKVNASDSTTITNTLSNVVAGGDLSITTPGTLSIAGANLSAGDVARVNAGAISITGVIDQTSSSTNTVNVKRVCCRKRPRLSPPAVLTKMWLRPLWKATRLS